ncbi:hypothetical protein HYC85_000977 [Camellia sinensis]|uniref:RRM domain-containing protein n=1 Tax=Camellia sinensis TaxID=4442 RepID=A0A7J7I6K0_CAMSI|nr:hypothetical protein HYC85_000977 [Camellia sinensis]
MEHQEHEVYGGDIPDEGEMDADVDMSRAEDDDLNSKDLGDMKKRLKEIEEEAGALREMQSKVEKEMGAVQDSSSPAAQAEKEEVDSRSIYVGNVDYVCTPEEVQQHFQSCGTVNRVTILTDKFGQPKGFAYVEFVEIEAVQNALLLNESELHGRQLKVSSKRTNIPGMKQYRGRRPNPYIEGFQGSDAPCGTGHTDFGSWSTCGPTEDSLSCYSNCLIYEASIAKNNGFKFYGWKNQSNKSFVVKMVRPCWRSDVYGKK